MLANLAKVRRQVRDMGAVSPLEAHAELERTRELMAKEAMAPLVGQADDVVVLTTVHQAKGLEWSVVFLLWLVEGRFPSARSLDSREDEEEERRLFYVATTRARDELYMCYPLMSYSARQGAMIHRLSRFVQEVGEDH